jgi:hypothetical protein
MAVYKLDLSIVADEKTIRKQRPHPRVPKFAVNPCVIESAGGDACNAQESFGSRGSL